MMENILNIFHYNIYLMLNNVHIIFNKINPLWLSFKIPYIKKFHKKHNHNPRNKHDELWMDDEKGYNILLSNIILGITVSFILTFIFLFVIEYFFSTEGIFVFVFITSMLLSFLISYKNILKENKYLIYFKKYKSYNKSKKSIYMLLSFLSFIGGIILFLLSFSI